MPTPKPINLKFRYVNPNDLEYPDCTSFVLTDVTINDKDQLLLQPIIAVAPNGTTVKLSVNPRLTNSPFHVKVWDIHGHEPADLTPAKVAKLLSGLKKVHARKTAATVKMSLGNKTAPGKKAAAEKKKR